ncbi:MAG: amidohydrolase [Solobacterium sp.]|nr:amidohydrolase [Solobacterium sp.]
MDNNLIQYIDDHREELLALGNTLFACPELGFKEFKTAEHLKKWLSQYGIKVEKEFDITGFSVSIGEGSPHIGILAELDAIPTPGHPFADPETGAAHACGHSTQLVIAVGALTALKETMKDLLGKVTVYFTPAEEFTDMEYRKSLVKEGKIRCCSGKQNMLAEHLFDDADVILHFHAMNSTGYRFSVGSVLSGFIYKKITFHGKASHAAALPDKGINALNECTLFLNAVNMLRETFRDEDVVRFHGMIAYGGNTVNSIPDKVIYECYVRSVNPDVVIDLNRRVTNAAECCAAAIGGSVTVEDTPGYLPFHQDETLNKVVYEHMLAFAEPDEILHGEMSPAAGDVGDVCMFKPVIQFGYSGFEGAIHGKDFAIRDPEEVYIVPAKLLASIVADLLEHPEKVEEVKKNYVPHMTYEEYMNYLNG